MELGVQSNKGRWGWVYNNLLDYYSECHEWDDVGVKITKRGLPEGYAKRKTKIKQLRKQREERKQKKKKKENVQ